MCVRSTRFVVSALINEYYYYYYYYQPNRYVVFFWVGGCENVMDEVTN